MTPKTKLPRKLSLNRETLRNLRVEDLERAAGAGRGYTRTCTMVNTCLGCLTAADCVSVGQTDCFTINPCTIG